LNEINIHHDRVYSSDSTEEIYKDLEVQFSSTEHAKVSEQAYNYYNIEYNDRKKIKLVRQISKTDRFKMEINPEIERFFLNEARKWHGTTCYQEMIDSNYNNKFQPEWVGFYLEYRFQVFLDKNKLQNKIIYCQNKSKGEIDLDLYFPSIESYGDLKAHSSHSRGIQGNDLSTILSIIEKPELDNHIYYVVCEHLTEKDSEFNYEVTNYWNKAQNKTDLFSYSKKMKNNVTLKTIYILDINYYNKSKLSIFRQGKNSNGKPREPKIMIEHDKIKEFLIHKIDL
jgi:hypothetical protein